MHFRPVDTQIEETLIEKCQQNGWLMRGGYDWQDDPYLEEYPYEFCVADDLEEVTGLSVRASATKTSHLSSKLTAVMSGGH